MNAIAVGIKVAIRPGRELDRQSYATSVMDEIVRAIAMSIPQLHPIAPAIEFDAFPTPQIWLFNKNTVG